MAVGDVIIKTFTVAGTGSGYLTNDVFGSETSVANCVNANGGSGRIFHVKGWDDTALMVPCDLYFASATASPAADSAQFNPSDANNRLYKARIELPTWEANTSNRAIEWDGVKGIFCAVNTLFLTVVMRATQASAIAASAVSFEVYIMQDQ